MIRIGQCGRPGAHLPFDIDFLSVFPELDSEFSDAVFPSITGFRFDNIETISGSPSGGEFTIQLGKRQAGVFTPQGSSVRLFLLGDGMGGWLVREGSITGPVVTQAYVNAPWSTCASAPPFSVHLEQARFTITFNHLFSMTPLLDLVTACSN